MNPEVLALWYLRLNGFFTIPSYIVHPAGRGGARTDVDVAGVRLPHRREFPAGPGGDDADLTALGHDAPLALLTEVKTGMCDLNGPWVGSDPQTVEQLLGDLGLVSQGLASTAAAALRSTSFYSDPSIHVRLLCIGLKSNPDLSERYPELPQRTWNDVSRFIFRRFSDFRRRKTDNRNWDEAGRTLWQRATEARSEDRFGAAIGPDFGVDAA